MKTQDPLKQHLLSRRLGSMEIMMLLLSFPIFHMTTASIFLVTTLPDERSAQVKPTWILMNDDGDGDAEEDPFFKDAIEHYLTRPHTAEFEDLTYFTYYMKYKLQRSQANGLHTLTDGFGYYVLRRRKVSQASLLTL